MTSKNEGGRYYLRELAEYELSLPSSSSGRPAVKPGLSRGVAFFLLVYLLHFGKLKQSWNSSWPLFTGTLCHDFFSWCAVVWDIEVVTVAV